MRRRIPRGLRGPPDDDEDDPRKVIDLASRRPKTGMARIEQVFADLEHLTSHNDPANCAECRRIAKGTITLRAVRFRRVVIESGRTRVIGVRKRPYDANAWTFTAVVEQADGTTRAECRWHSDDENVKKHMWHNQGPGHDEGGNNRAGWVLDFLARYERLDESEFDGTRSYTRYKIIEHVEIEGDRDGGPPSPRGA